MALETVPVPLDAHAKPPSSLRNVYKHYHKLKPTALESHPDLIQFDGYSSSSTSHVRPTRLLDLPTELRQFFSDFLGTAHAITLPAGEHALYEVPDVPGLFIYPSLFPPQIQLELLSRLLHRDLTNPQHMTNVHTHYNVQYPSKSEDEDASFFDESCRCTVFEPHDPALHKPISTEQFLNKKLRWTTLGGQYDWTNKVYPSGPPPAFPPDIKKLVEDIFPMRAEAAIVNLYSPGDTLSLHRDVSEECNRPLASISLGCDAIFMAGLDDEAEDGKSKVAVMRLRSGDAVLMSGESRYAWHGVPKVLQDTCPGWMADWPGNDADGIDRYQHWAGWMKGKRVNLNVRQMFG
ncbi:unnamed protein product [Zymoseptoria tritici ST99CH_1A5]|uniref:mRNA N(6)-methyladenine demethylase n=3 Tax=Zymoseptoria tritici TaxID=1047171 RepID=A0A1X7RRG2_ZYMT9|nr:unnamed protein product [Zymoseptoria tritici ST99CH_3D7]SMR51014.1 unnamed protein product [Zymoseptoria tritici ST99CH_1E4]SMR51953.1 unnamed protein product [Zymoseptoria tritici ST99CH_3D1]SMY23707.1 unnamed protein product [Zymoseptoria tritici ST99CH_1A5]